MATVLFRPPPDEFGSAARGGYGDLIGQLVGLDREGAFLLLAFPIRKHRMLDLETMLPPSTE